MVEMLTLTFDEQVQALEDCGLAQTAPALHDALTTGRRPRAVPRSILTPARSVVPLAQSASQIVRRGRPLVLGHLEVEELETFVPIDAVDLPETPSYLAIDVDLGAGSRNERPEDALRGILAAGRSPLTIDEGVALLLQQPEAIARNWGFSTAGSRRDDQRVPAFWVSEGRPKLGWCWDRNPHTWLGTASCAGRLAVC